MKTIYLSLICLLISFVGHSQIIPNGPDAPDVSIQFLNSEFQLYLSNPMGSNNYQESYLEQNYNLDSLAPDQFWRFQGYIVYQVIDNSVSVFETTDPNYVRIAAIVDLADTISTLVYTSYDSIVGCVSQTLNAPNTGIPNGIMLSNDAFTGQPFLQDQSYCFKVFAYGSNLYNTYPGCTTPDQIVSSWTTGHGTLVSTHCASATESLSIVENEESSLTCYPNPVTDLLVIESHSEEPIEIIIRDTGGRSIAEFTTAEMNTFDFSNYNPGYYFLHSRAITSGLTQTYKIIVVE
ncbi:MAG: T9SS type A sorting domain-containing protein [Crocinitomicaceae bacterium]|nr:T9SS type A sorting domain-containing protein [Crocinitomicaceae bacterium]